MFYHKAEYLSLPDRSGNVRFFLYWMSNFHIGDPKGEHRLAERGQIFKTNPLTKGIPLPQDVKCPVCNSLKKSEQYGYQLACGSCGSKIVLELDKNKP